MMNKQKNSHLVQLFMWKVHFLLGETIMNVQNFLIAKKILKQCLLIERPQIQRIAYKIIEESEKMPASKDFLKLKELIKRFYHRKSNSTKKTVALYNQFTKLSRNHIKFELAFKFLNIEQEQRKRNQQASRKRFNIVYLNKQFKDGQIAQLNNVGHQKSVKNLGGTINRKEKVVQTILITDDNERGAKNRWSPSEQAIFCKIYSETDSPAVCVQLMQKQLGPDVRWKAASQIEAKMYFLVTKVFNKVINLTTNNQYIKIFRDNKKIVLVEAEPVIRKKIFRNIAIIYQSMLNITEEKKAVITQKILEVNRLCRDAKLMK